MLNVDAMVDYLFLSSNHFDLYTILTFHSIIFEMNFLCFSASCLQSILILLTKFKIVIVVYFLLKFLHFAGWSVRIWEALLRLFFQRSEQRFSSAFCEKLCLLIQMPDGRFYWSKKALWEFQSLARYAHFLSHVDHLELLGINLERLKSWLSTYSTSFVWLIWFGEWSRYRLSHNLHCETGRSWKVQTCTWVFWKVEADHRSGLTIKQLATAIKKVPFFQYLIN